MKIVNIDGESLHIYWTTWGILMKSSREIWPMIILKITKKPGLHPLSRRCIFGKTTGGGWGGGAGSNWSLTPQTFKG